MTAQRRRRAINSIGVSLLSAVLLIWTLLPIYNIIRVVDCREKRREVPSQTSVYPDSRPSLHAFQRSWSTRRSGCWRHSGTR